MQDSFSKNSYQCKVKSDREQINLGGSYSIGCLPVEVSKSFDPKGLEVNLILVNDGRNEVLFLSIDAMYIGPEIRSFTEELFGEGFKPEQIFMAASHTHNAPGLDATKPDLFDYSYEFTQATKTALELLHSRLAKSQYIESTISETEFFPEGIVNRRKAPPAWMVKLGLMSGGFLQLTNLKSTPKISATSLAFWNEGRLLCCICVYPCHPVAYPNKSEVSADYVGSFRDAIRRQNENGPGKKQPAFVFMQGASGELRPKSESAGRVGSLREVLFRVLIGNPFGRFGSEDYELWANSRAEELVSAISSGKRKSASKLDIRIDASRLEVPLSQHFRLDLESARKISFHVVQLGELQLVGVSSEISWDFSREIRAVLPTDKNQLLIGCIDDTFGYTPSESQITEGGYEVDGWLTSFGLIPSTSAEQRVEGLKALISQVANKTTN